jgi:hypothetical protein
MLCVILCLTLPGVKQRTVAAHLPRGVEMSPPGEGLDKSQEMWTLPAAIAHGGGIAYHVSLACRLLLEEFIGLDKSVHGTIFRTARRTKTALVYMGNERTPMPLHEQSHEAVEALAVLRPSPFKQVEQLVFFWGERDRLHRLPHTGLCL